MFYDVFKSFSSLENITAALDSNDYLGDVFCPNEMPKRFELPIDGKLKGFEALMFVPYSQMLTDGALTGSDLLKLHQRSKASGALIVLQLDEQVRPVIGADNLL